MPLSCRRLRAVTGAACTSPSREETASPVSCAVQHMYAACPCIHRWPCANTADQQHVQSSGSIGSTRCTTGVAEQTSGPATPSSTCRAYAIRDYYPFWKSRNERSRAGKLLLLDRANEDVIQIFFDDNIGHGSANIVDVRDVKSGEPIAFQVTSHWLPVCFMPVYRQGDKEHE